MYSNQLTTLTMCFLNTVGVEISNLRGIMVGQKFQMLPIVCCSSYVKVKKKEKLY